MTFEEASTGVGVKIFTWIYTFVQLIGDILKWKFQISKATQKLNFLKVLRFSFPVPFPVLISGSSAENIKNLPLALRAREKFPGGPVGKSSRKSHWSFEGQPRAQGFFFSCHSKPTNADVFPVFGLAENTSAFSGYPLPSSFESYCRAGSVGMWDTAVWFYRKRLDKVSLPQKKAKSGRFKR